MLKRKLLGIPIPVWTGILILLVIGFIGGPLGRSVFGDLGLSGWLSIPRPVPKLPAEEVFHLLGFPITNSVIGAWLTIVFLVVFSYAVTRRMKIVPGRLQSAFELLLGWLYDFCKNVAGEKHGRQFFPVVATIFLFVAFNAWLSLVPGFGSITVTTAGGEHAQVQVADGAIVELDADGRVVDYLVRIVGDVVELLAAKRGNPFRSSAEPPFHDIKVVAVLVDHSATGAAIVNDPPVDLLEEGPAILLAPDELRSTHGAIGDEVADPLEIG